MADLNKCFLIGRLTFDPELRQTPGGTAVTDLRVATSRKWKTKDGEDREETLYVDVTVWNRQAENCVQYLKKGASVHVEGYLKTETWDDKKTGEKRSKIKIEADRVQFLDAKGTQGGGEGGESRGGDRRGSQGQSGGPSRGQGQGGYGGRGAATPPPRQDEDSDIPF